MQWRAGVVSAEPDELGPELPFVLMGAFRRVIDDLHERLAREGHPQVRPAHAVALQAVGTTGARPSEVATRIGVSKQAAGKTLLVLEELGYVQRQQDPEDGRAQKVDLTARGRDLLAHSARILQEIFEELGGAYGTNELRTVVTTLARVRDEGEDFRGLVRWFGDRP